MNLSKQMIDTVKATNPQELTPTGMGVGLNDYDQRSAIGMARAWVDNREPIRWKVEQVEYPKRDQLAKDLVSLMEENPAEPEEYVEALKAVRKVVNAPYQRDSVHTGADLRKPGEKKKAKE
jgi:hypothetical protein